MAEFLETIETINAEAASVEHLFGGEGTSPRRIQKSVEYKRKLSESAKFLAEVFQGKRPLYQLREAMTTSDFPYLFGDIIDRQSPGELPGDAADLGHGGET